MARFPYASSGILASAALVALGIAPARSSAQAIHVVPEARFITGLSADGRLAVGYNVVEFLYWTVETGAIYIGGVAPGLGGVGGSCSVSDDGTRIVGNTLSDLGKTEASVFSIPEGMWTSSGSLGFSCDITASSGWAISRDGQVIGGGIISDGGCSYKGMRWSSGTGIRTLPTAYFFKPTRVNAMNADGTVIVGWNDDYNGWRQGSVWVWNGTSFTQTLITAPDGTKMGEASCVSADGTRVFGHGPFNGEQKPYVWTMATKAVALGDSPKGLPGYASACNADGTIAACFFRAGPPPTSGEGYMWIEGRGFVAIEVWATENGVILPTEMHLSLPTCVSADGRSVGGAGRNDTEEFAFVLNLPPLASCDGDLDSSGAIDGLDLTALLAGWGVCGASCSADLNSDGVVDGLDLTVILSGWGDCP